MGQHMGRNRRFGRASGRMTQAGRRPMRPSILMLFDSAETSGYGNTAHPNVLKAGSGRNWFFLTNSLAFLPVVGGVTADARKWSGASPQFWTEIGTATVTRRVFKRERPMSG